MSRLNWRETVIYSGAGLALAGLAILGAGPVGWRAGWWSFTVSLKTLTPLAAYLGLSGAALSLLGLTLVRARSSRLIVAAGLIGLAAGAIATYAPWKLRSLIAAYPPINDISTDLANPPAFVTALPPRAAENAVSADYPGRETARSQTAAYPDIAPVETSLAPAAAYKLALTAAKAMPGWRLAASSATEGRIEASQSSCWYGFVDDVVIRVAPTPGGSRIDVRSHSRQGRSDLGINAARVRAYLAAITVQLDVEAAGKRL
jgi:uncharacterized protein (DUF1499 family)